MAAPTTPAPGINLDSIQRRPIGEPHPLRRLVVKEGVLQYEDGGEVSLWGVNFQTMISWEYLNYLQPSGVPLDSKALKKITDENLDQLVLMGCNVCRCHLGPGDFTDAQGHLVNTIYLDQLDYFLAACRVRSIYVHLTLLNNMGESQKDSYVYPYRRNPRKPDWMLRQSLVTSSERYVQALLNRINPYTHMVYHDEPAVGLIEVINEPAFYSYTEMQTNPACNWLKTMFKDWRVENGKTSGNAAEVYDGFSYAMAKKYIDRMYAVIRGTGAKQPVIWNILNPWWTDSHEPILQAVADSKVEAISMCHYPHSPQLDKKHPTDQTPINLLPRNVEAYGPGLHDHHNFFETRFANKAKVIYEFENVYNQCAYLYPADARLFRSLGAQSATMWRYSLMPGALNEMGSHYLNLLTTPEKAVSFMIGGEAMKQAPRYARYDTATQDVMQFGNCYLSFSKNNSLFCDGKRLLYARNMDKFPIPVSDTVRQITATGSSPWVSYGGNGVYFINIGKDQLDLEVMPNVAFTKPCYLEGSQATLDYEGKHPMTLHLPGWNNKVTIRKTAGNNVGPVPLNGTNLTFAAAAGHYQINRAQ